LHFFCNCIVITRVYMQQNVCRTKGAPCLLFAFAFVSAFSHKPLPVRSVQLTLETDLIILLCVADIYFVPVTCFLLFNTSDVIGRSLSGVFLWVSFWSHISLHAFCFRSQLSTGCPYFWSCTHLKSCKISLIHFLAGWLKTQLSQVFSFVLLANLSVCEYFDYFYFSVFNLFYVCFISFCLYLAHDFVVEAVIEEC